MRYMASVNRFFWYLFMPIIIIFYISFVIWSYTDHANSSLAKLVDNKKQAVNSITSLDGIILGGSNAHYGISAISLNKLSNLTWMNFAIPGEGYSDKNYLNFITKSLREDQRLNISFVVYSSAAFVRKNLRQEISSLDLVGRNKINYKPQRALASYLKSALGYNYYEELQYQIINEYGDLDFSNYKCNFLAESSYSRNFLNEEDLNIWTPAQLMRLSTLFPNAKIILSIPDGFNGDSEDPNVDARGNLLKTVEGLLRKNNESGNISFYLTSERSFPSSDLMCDDSWHPNEEGRSWRTEQLFQFIDDQLLKNIEREYNRKK